MALLCNGGFDEAAELRKEMGILAERERLIRESGPHIRKMFEAMSRENLAATNLRTFAIEMASAVFVVRLLARGLRKLVLRRRTGVEPATRVIEAHQKSGMKATKSQAGKLGGEASAYSRQRRALQKETADAVAEESLKPSDRCSPQSRVANLPLFDGLAEELRSAKEVTICHARRAVVDEAGARSALEMLSQILELIDPFSNAVKLNERLGEDIERRIGKISEAYATAYGKALKEIRLAKQTLAARILEIERACLPLRPS